MNIQDMFAFFKLSHRVCVSIMISKEGTANDTYNTCNSICPGSKLEELYLCEGPVVSKLTNNLDIFANILESVYIQ